MKIIDIELRNNCQFRDDDDNEIFTKFANQRAF